MMTSEETMDLLSSVRLGINLGLCEDVSMPTVNELFIHTQPPTYKSAWARPWTATKATPPGLSICAPGCGNRIRIDQNQIAAPHESPFLV